MVDKVIAKEAPSTLILVEHPPVITLGASFHPENLLHSPESLADRGIEVHPNDRGGDVTYHGPGQLIAYPIFDLEMVGKDLHVWLRNLEQAVMDTVESFDLKPRRFAPHTGVWIEDKKVCAIGIKVRRWVSMHGLALNVNPDLAAFDLIVPCGIQGYGVTSLSQELGSPVPISLAKERLLLGFAGVFQTEWETC